MNEEKRKVEYWDCDECAEILNHTDPDDAIEYLLDGLLGPEMTGKQVREALPEKLEVKGYARMKIAVQDPLEFMIENLYEEYGNPEGDPSDGITDDMRKAADALMKVVEEQYKPWACEPVETEEIDVIAWVEKNRPDWLE